MCICGTVERELKMKTSKCVTIERNLYPHIHTNTKKLKRGIKETGRSSCLVGAAGKGRIFQLNCKTVLLRPFNSGVGVCVC